MKPGSHRQTVLVVDDSDDIRLIAAKLLKLGGIDTAIARDGVEALEYLQTESAPSAIVLDIQMPRLDGWQFLSAIACEDAWKSIPVVMCSCQDSEFRVVPPNVVAWIDKVTMTDHLLVAVRAALYKPSVVCLSERSATTNADRKIPEIVDAPW